MAFQINPIQVDSMFREENQDSERTLSLSERLNLSGLINAVSYVVVGLTKVAYSALVVNTESKRNRLVDTISGELPETLKERKQSADKAYKVKDGSKV